MKRHRDVFWLLGLICVVALFACMHRSAETPPSATAPSRTLHFSAEKGLRHYEFIAREDTSSWTASWVQQNGEPLAMRGELRPGELRNLVSDLYSAGWWGLKSLPAAVGEERYVLTLETPAGARTVQFSGRPDDHYGAVLDRLTHSRVYDREGLDVSPVRVGPVD